MHINRHSQFVRLEIIKQTIVAFALLLFELSGAVHAGNEKRVALVIGNSDYQHVSNLKNPAKTNEINEHR